MQGSARAEFPAQAAQRRARSLHDHTLLPTCTVEITEVMELQTQCWHSISSFSGKPIHVPEDYALKAEYG